jgi:hypothetical protein
MSTNHTTRIAERRRFIQQRTAELQAELEALTAEGKDLDVAERVLARLSELPTIGGNAEKAAESVLFDPAEEGEDHDQGPTLPQMVFTILEDARAHGRKGVDSAEMLKVIKERWRPDFTAEQLRPTLWRMVKKKRLKKQGKIYCVPTVPPNGEAEAVGASARH